MKLKILTIMVILCLTASFVVAATMTQTDTTIKKTDARVVISTEGSDCEIGSKDENKDTEKATEDCGTIKTAEKEPLIGTTETVPIEYEEEETGTTEKTPIEYEEEVRRYCPESKPYKCEDNSCVVSEDECTEGRIVIRYVYVDKESEIVTENGEATAEADSISKTSPEVTSIKEPVNVDEVAQEEESAPSSKEGEVGFTPQPEPPGFWKGIGNFFSGIFGKE
jgi:hypothetical protein